MKKKFLVMLSLTLAVFLMSSCGGNSSSAKPESTSPKKEIKEQPKEKCSYCYKSINGAGYKGHYGEPYCDLMCFADKN